MYEIFESIEDNKEIYSQYNILENYQIETVNSTNSFCWIFFTSHGLYFPTTLQNFKKEVLDNDKYEWKGISKDEKIRKKASKFIYVRDIYKNWCLHGINNKIDSIEKLAEFLKELADGKEIITVGSSAGGYMAIALGSLLKAKYIYAFSPQISLLEYDNFHSVKYLQDYNNNEKFKNWLSLKDIIYNYTYGKLFYIYPTRCAEDASQFEQIKEAKNDNLFIFSVKFYKHGTPIYGESVKETLAMHPDKLVKLCNKYIGNEISRNRYLIDTSGLIKATVLLIGSKVKRLCKMLTFSRVCFNFLKF